MAIVINGSGTVTGLAVGGLPDGTVDNDTIASGVTSSKLTGALPAISGASLTNVPQDMVLISTTNVTDGDSYVTLSNVFTSTYDKYILEGLNFLPNTDNSAIRGNFQTGGSTWQTNSTYDTMICAVSGGNVQSWINLTNASYAAFSGQGNQGNGSNEQCNFMMEVLEPDASRETFWKTQDICYAANGTCAAIFGGGCWRTGTPVTGVRFYYSSGTFKTGTLKLYGVK